MLAALKDMAIKQKQCWHFNPPCGLYVYFFPQSNTVLVPMFRRSNMVQRYKTR